MWALYKHVVVQTSCCSYEGALLIVCNSLVRLRLLKLDKACSMLNQCLLATNPAPAVTMVTLEKGTRSRLSPPLCYGQGVLTL